MKARRAKYIYNKFILSIGTTKKWGQKNHFPLDKEFFLLFFFATINIALEFFLNPQSFFSLEYSFLQIAHLLIFLILPLYLFSRSLKKTALLFLTIFAIIFPLYFFILSKIISFYFIALSAISLVFIYHFFKNNPTIAKTLGLNFRKQAKNIFLGALLGILFCSHLFLVLSLSKDFSLNHFHLPSFWIKMFFEINFGILGIEVFFRYFLFLRLIKKFDFSFLLAFFISTIFYLAPFLINSDFNQSTPLIVGTIYYTILESYISCYLIYKTKSVLPAFFMNLIMSIFITIFFN